MARRRTRTLNQDSAGVDMTPMLDIVFILLIFFIVTAVFLDERGLDFTKAQGDTTGDPIPAIAVTIDADNQVRVEGRVVPLSLVQAEVQVHLVNKPNAPVSFLAEERARLQDVIRIKDEMERAGRNVSFDIYAEAQRSAKLD